MANNYSNKNAAAVLAQVQAHIAELQEANKTASWNLDHKRYTRRGYSDTATTQFNISEVYDELSIFDWWNETLSMSQLKQMEKFLEQAIKLGFTGYVCFKVGAKGCSHGMWAHKQESTNGYSPDGDVLFHSFRSGDRYFDMQLDGKWMRDILPDKDGEYQFTMADVKQAMDMMTKVEDEKSTAMKIKDVQKILASSMDAKVFVCNSREEAMDEISTEQFNFDIYTELDDNQANMEVVYVYTQKREELEVWAIA